MSPRPFLTTITGCFIALSWLSAAPAGAAEAPPGVDAAAGNPTSVYEQIAGSTWSEPLGGTITLERDASIRHSDPQIRGSWGVIGLSQAAGARRGAVAVVFENGWVGVWRFDAPPRAYEASAYERTDRTYEGKLAAKARPSRPAPRPAPGGGARGSDAFRLQVVGTTWTEPLGGTITLNADGTIRHSDPQYGGTWGAAGPNSVAIEFRDGPVDVWQFDEAVLAYSGTTYRRMDQGYRGELKSAAPQDAPPPAPPAKPARSAPAAALAAPAPPPDPAAAKLAREWLDKARAAAPPSDGPANGIENDLQGRIAAVVSRLDGAEAGVAYLASRYAPAAAATPQQRESVALSRSTAAQIAARLLAEGGRVDEAVTFLRAQPADDSQELYLALLGWRGVVDRLLHNGRAADALRLAEAAPAVPADPNRGNSVEEHDPRRMAADAAKQLAEMDALATGEGAPRKAPEGQDPLVVLGWLIRGGRLDDARRTLERFPENADEDSLSSARAALALQLARRGDRDGAPELAKASERQKFDLQNIHSERADRMADLAETYATLGDRTGARRIMSTWENKVAYDLRTNVGAASPDADTSARLMRVYVMLGDVAKAKLLTEKRVLGRAASPWDEVGPVADAFARAGRVDLIKSWVEKLRGPELPPLAYPFACVAVAAGALEATPAKSGADMVAEKPSRQPLSASAKTPTKRGKGSARSPARAVRAVERGPRLVIEEVARVGSPAGNAAAGAAAGNAKDHEHFADFVALPSAPVIGDEGAVAFFAVTGPSQANGAGPTTRRASGAGGSAARRGGAGPSTRATAFGPQTRPLGFGQLGATAAGPRSLWVAAPGGAPRRVVIGANGESSDPPRLSHLTLHGIDAAGRVLVSGTIADQSRGDASGHAIWYGPSDALELVARAGEPMPGGAANTSNVGADALGSTGTILAHAVLPVGVIYYAGPADALQPLAMPRQQLAGATRDGGPINAVSITPAMNGRGEFLLATVRGPPGGDRVHELWLGAPGNWRKLAATGDAASGLPDGGGTFDRLDGRGGLAVHALGDGGHAAFTASAKSKGLQASSPDQFGVWAGRPGELALVARRGDVLPGCVAGEPLFTIDERSLSVDASGAVVFTGQAGQGGRLTHAAWVWADGKLALLCKSGTPIEDVRGLPAGVTAAPAGELKPMIDADGQVVQLVELAGPSVTHANRAAVAVYRRGQNWSLVARCGDAIDTRPTPGARAGSKLRHIDWVGPPNAQGQFLLLGEAAGRPGKTLFRATLPKG